MFWHKNNREIFYESKTYLKGSCMKFDYLKKTALKMSSRPFLILTKNDFFIEKEGIAVPLYLVS